MFFVYCFKANLYGLILNFKMKALRNPIATIVSYLPSLLIKIIEITHSQPIKADSTLIRLGPNMNTRRDDNE